MKAPYLKQEKMENFDQVRITRDDSGIETQRTHFLGNVYHRIDGPAIIRKDGSIQYYVKGKRHRIDGPAWITSDGVKYWYINNKCYPSEAEFNYAVAMLNSPAEVTADVVEPKTDEKPDENPKELKKDFEYIKIEGTVWKYYLGSELHRLNGPAIENKSDPNHYGYYVNGKLHRVDGPAKSDRFSKYWYVNGQRHRDDGPACEYLNGDKVWYKNGERHRLDGAAIKNKNGTKAWYIEGVEYTKMEFIKKVSEIQRVQLSSIPLPVKVTPKKYTIILDGVEYHADTVTFV